ncbi:hypothetical protein D6C93_08738 [Aureobasidium pullulans]|uniref:C2H2-type domain-containing protein n=1 Tax=Aureobasidium pullulans TaxID=5580 RepID=A0A4S8VCJ9_AURPU|nr:hypothetical protein D6D24_08639 [Aureobasidium pullulans]THY83844.1 hypothetical protein D6C93_08738 [Aureobasidium pullulans]
MIPGSDSMGAPTSFSSRRPNASNLPNFELPPPQLTSLHQKYHSYAGTSQPTPSIPSSLTSVGNLLTPPSGISSDGLSPNSSNMPTGSSHANHSVPPFTPTGYMWPPSHTGTTPYGFQSHNSPNQRGLFSPSLNSIVKGNNSPHTSENLPPPNFPENPFPTSMSMSAPVNLPALPSQSSSIGSAMMGGHTPVTQASPVNHHDSFARPPPTPTYFNGSQHSHNGQPAYGYSSGPSPVQQSPMSAGGQIPRMSPANGHGQIPPLQPQNVQSPYTHQRPSYQYPLPGPVLSNVGNPNSQLALVGGMPPSMMPAYNSGHAAHMQHMYGHHPQAQPNPQNDRPFKCDQCPQSFNRNHDLKRHKRIHLAVKPFPCGHCDKSFSRKDALKRHILVKGCGKAPTNSGDNDRKDGSISPAMKSENSSPAVSASA